jgi:hypothetical protein
LHSASFGIKAGINFANVTKVSSIDHSSQSGFHGGVLLAPPSKGLMGYRTELLYSRRVTTIRQVPTLAM